MSKTPKIFIKKYPAFTILLIYSVVVGSLSYSIGERDLYVVINPVGSTISGDFYNYVLIPYWKETMTPIDYETTDIVEIETGEVVGKHSEPVYDFPIKGTCDLCFPITVMVFGSIGLLIERFRRIYKKRK